MSEGACSSCGLRWREKSPGCERHLIFNERAAFLEWDAKKTRDEAERLAVLAMQRMVVER